MYKNNEKEEDMYFKDVLVKLKEKENFPIIIYLIVNVVIIYLVVAYFLGMYQFGPIPCVISSVVLCGISMSVALSPLGEAILRKKLGCQRIDAIDVLNEIEPDFVEVYESALQLSADIAPDVELMMIEGGDINAFAVGRKTICITEGFMLLPSEERKACLAHEFGHVANKDTDLIVMVTIGNFIVSIAVSVLKFFFLIAQWIGKLIGFFMDDGKLIGGFTTAVSVGMTFVVGGLMKLWTNFGASIVLKTNRLKEYDADGYAFNLGYGDGLLSFLSQNIPVAERDDVFAVLASTHPQKFERIEKLKSMGAM